MHVPAEQDRTPTQAMPQPATLETNERLQRGKVPDSVVVAILDALSGVKFGQITVTVQDGYVVQIERLERRRLKT
jgi:hypothetical protein